MFGKHANGFFKTVCQRLCRALILKGNEGETKGDLILFTSFLGLEIWSLEPRGHPVPMIKRYRNVMIK